MERVELRPVPAWDAKAARLLRAAGWLLAMALRKGIPLGVTFTLATCKMLLGAHNNDPYMHHAAQVSHPTLRICARWPRKCTPRSSSS